MAGRRTSLCYCQSKARQRHIAVSNTIVSCLPQANSGSYSQNLRALAVSINNQGNCQQPAALPKPSSTCHHLMLQPHLEKPEFSSGFTENKCFIYESVQLPWFAEQHMSGLSQAQAQLICIITQGVSQRTSICFAPSQSHPITE